MALPAGTRLGAYDILSPIGEGGMGQVYRARDTRLGRDVAIKVLPPGFTNDPDRRARFEREAQAVATLSHPNVVSIFDSGEHAGQIYVVMELLAGESLRQDGRGIIVAKPSAVPMPIERVDIATGTRTLVRELAPPDRGGLNYMIASQWIDDGRGYSYTYIRELSRIFVVTGLR